MRLQFLEHDELVPKMNNIDAQKNKKKRSVCVTENRLRY